MLSIGNRKNHQVTMGNKQHQPATMGNRFGPKNNVTGNIQPTPTGEIVNYSNTKEQVYDPIRGNGYKPPSKNAFRIEKE